MSPHLSRRVDVSALPKFKISKCTSRNKIDFIYIFLLKLIISRRLYSVRDKVWSNVFYFYIYEFIIGEEKVSGKDIK